MEESSPGGEWMWGASKRVLSIMMPDLGGEGNRDVAAADDVGSRGVVEVGKSKFGAHGQNLSFIAV